MTIAKDFAAKLSVAFVAAAMIFSAFAPSASAQTTEELQQMINDLLAQIAQLEGSTGVNAGTGACVSIPAPLTIGSQGADVTALQNVLIGNGYSIPAGATGYFGTQTQSALAAWQADNGVSPAVGYYGPITKAAIDASCTPMDDMDDDMDDDMMDDDDDMMMDLQGEGTLDEGETDLDDASDDEIMEGDEEVEIATLTLGAQDGDILLTRILFALDGTGNEEDEPWDVFEEISLWVDGDKIADFEADDEDNYTDEDNGEFRITNIGLVIEEDEEVEIVIGASVNNNVDGSDTPGNADWTIDALEVRYFDADDVATDEDIDSDTTPADFSIEEEGADDDADIESSSSDPDSATLEVDEDGDDSDEFVVFVFDIDVDEDSNDLIFEDNAFATVTVTGSGATPAGATADDVIEEVIMTIDGEEVDGDDVSGLNGSIVGGASTDVVYEFDFEDLELEGDEEYEVTVSIIFKGQDGNYDNGVTIDLSVVGDDWELDGVEDDNVLDGSATSETHTLSTAVPTISDVDSTSERNEETTQGTISFEFTVSADGDNDVTFDVANNSMVNGSTDDIEFTLTGGAATTTATTSFALVDGDATFSGGTWTVLEGDEATFALDTAFDGTQGAGTYRVTLDRVAGVEVDETSNGMTLVSS